MKQSTKHLIAAVLTIAFITFISVKVVMHYNKHIDFISKEIEGTTILPHMKTLVLQTQELSTLILIATDSQKKEKTDKFYQNFHTTLQKLELILNKSNFCESKKLFKKIKNNLELSKKFLSSKDRVKAYEILNNIVDNELKFITYVANESNLILDPKLTTYYLMDSVVNAMPQFIQKLLQTEALYSRENKDRLSKQFMQSLGQLSDQEHKLYNTFGYIIQYNPQYKKDLIKYYNTLQNRITNFITLLQHKSPNSNIETQLIIHNKKILEELSHIYTVNTNLLTKLLSKRLQEYHFERNLIITSSLLFFILILFLLYILSKHNTIAKRNKFLAYHDQLTLLSNKYAFDRDLHISDPSSALLIDIKQFSLINDLYGEYVGDLVLQAFANILRQITQEYQCKIYRIGSDQFMILNTGQALLCQKIAKNIFKYCNTNAIKIDTKEKQIPILLKVRIARIDIDKNNKKDKLSCKIRADIALNYAKKKHKDYIAYDKELQLEEKIQQELEIVDMVKNAILDNRVIPVFQKIQKKSEDTYESLVRIQDKDDPNKLISPAFFLETIYNTSYYAQITKIMIKKSFDTFLHRKESFSINFSFEDINNKSTIKYLINMIEKYHMQDRVIIELLETEAMQNLAMVHNFIQRLKKYGVRIAIDDFGSGYSNFIYLAEIEPDFIKIDGSIIKNIDTNSKSFIIAKHINKFAKEIGCQTIAEFVHSQDVQEKLKELDIDGLQGYYIQKPQEVLPLS